MSFEEVPGCCNPRLRCCLRRAFPGLPSSRCAGPGRRGGSAPGPAGRQARGGRPAGAPAGAPRSGAVGGALCASVPSRGSTGRFRLAAAVAALGALSAASCAPRRRRPERIVLVVADTLRSDRLSSYGGRTPTPNIDALAARGQKFTGMLASFHQTTMSMGALFTGRTPSLESGKGRAAIGWNGRTWCGLARFAGAEDQRRCIPAKVRTLGEAMREAGYWTAAVVTNRLLFRPAGFDRGFDRWVELVKPGARPVGRVGTVSVYPSSSAAEVNAAVRKLLSERPSDSFFLYVHYMDVHDYWILHRSYDEMVRSLDAAIGELMDSLEAEGLRAGTVVIFTADHGERLGEAHFVEGKKGHRGNPSFEEVLHVPLIVSPPVFPDAPPTLRSEDLFRLLVRLAGAPRAAASDLGPDELFLSEVHWQTYRRGRWKTYRDRQSGRVYLVDLEDDPREAADVGSLHPGIVARQVRRIEALSRRLAGRAPAGAHLTAEDRRRLRALGYAY